MNRIVNDGLAALEKQLLALPKELRDEAAGIVRASAQHAADEIRAAYPSKTGNLRRGVRVSYGERGKSTLYRYAATVVSAAPHAWIFEHGTTKRTVARRPPWPVSNFGLSRGRMPAGYIFEPRVERHRQRMENDIASMLARRGFRVVRRVA